jgi:GntR family transcriptional repressor for pyruvate dehydrogenase complex
MLEIEIAGTAALQATKEDLSVLQQALNRLELTQDDPKAYAGADAEFHQILARTTHNPLLRILLGSIRDLMHEVRLMVQRHPKLIEQTMSDHRQIFDRVTARDPDAARQAMEAHLKHARQIQEEVLREQGVDEA